MNETSNWMNARNENGVVVCNWDTMKRKMGHDDNAKKTKPITRLRSHFTLSQKLFNVKRLISMETQITKEPVKRSSSNCAKVQCNRAHSIRPFYRREWIAFNIFILFSVHRFIPMAIARKMFFNEKNISEEMKNINIVRHPWIRSIK